MVEITNITHSDIPEIVNLMEKFYAIDGYPIDVAKSTSLFETFIADERLGLALKILVDEKLAGYMIMVKIFSFEMAGYVLLLDELYISDDFRGKGLGRKVIQYAKETLKDGYAKLVLEVEPHNENAIQLYTSEQFRKHKRFLMIYP